MAVYDYHDTIEYDDANSFLIGFASSDSTSSKSSKDEEGASIQELTAELEMILNSDDVSSDDYNRAIQQIIKLFHQSDAHVLKSLSLYLCHLREVPERIINFLANSAFTVAEPLLENSPCLSEKMMMSLVRQKSAEYWQVLAIREDLTSIVIEALADCKDVETCTRLLDNLAIKLTERAFSNMLPLTKDHHVVANKMSTREELPQQYVLELYWKISKNLRHELSKQHHIPKKDLSRAFRDTLEEFKDRIGATKSFEPTPLMWELSKEYYLKNKITPSLLIKALHDSRVRFFIALFAIYTGLNHRVILKAMSQPGGRMLTLICRANNFKKEHFVSLFLRSRASLRSDKPVDSKELHEAIRLFDRTDISQAKSILAA